VKIQIGLVTHSSGWEQLCAQEGVSFSTIDLAAQSLANECSLLIVNRTLSPNEREVVQQYLRGGGAIVGYTDHLHKVADVEGTEQDLAYVVADHNDVFPSVHLLDLGVRGLVPRGANTLRTDTNTFAIAAGPLGGGYAVVLPFDVDALLHDARSANKNFYFTLDRLPSERVSLVSKGELRQLVHGAFQYLHHVRGIPYIHLWYFPRDLKNVFAFRIDSDGASREDVDKLYEIGRENNVPLSWFLDVKSHEQWLSHFMYFVEQEIGLHCYEHQTYQSYDENLKNVAKGLQEMRRAGLQPTGFAAPYGIWNPELARAIDQSGFEYSSEFSYAHDTFPLFAEAGVLRFKTLQVPIHPICIGSMAKAGYSDDRMIEYFIKTIRLKLSRQEPLFFYHHPSHRNWDVVRWLFNFRENGVEKTTLGEYARWWKRRIGVKYTASVDGEIVRIQYAGAPAPDDVWIRLINAKNEEVILPVSEKVDLKSVGRWTAPGRPLAPPDDIRRMREFDPRQMVGELYNTVIRKLR
jgi:hypothetical protein